MVKGGSTWFSTSMHEEIKKVGIILHWMSTRTWVVVKLYPFTLEIGIEPILVRLSWGVKIAPPFLLHCGLELWLFSAFYWTRTWIINFVLWYYFQFWYLVIVKGSKRLVEVCLLLIYGQAYSVTRYWASCTYILIILSYQQI